MVTLTTTACMPNASLGWIWPILSGVPICSGGGVPVEAHAANGETRRPNGGKGGRDRERERRPRPVARLWYLLLLLPFVGLLWIPFYAKHGPELFGFPFF